jgi:hypothetical protein
MENEEKVCAICSGEICNCNESDLYEMQWSGLQDQPEHYSIEEEEC